MNLHFPRLHSAWRLWNPSSPKLPRNLYLDIHRLYHIYLTFREISIFSAPFPCDNWKSKNPGENCESIFSLLVQKINPSKLLRRKNQKKINPPTCFLRFFGGFLSETCGFPCSNASTEPRYFGSSHSSHNLRRSNGWRWLFCSHAFLQPKKHGRNVFFIEQIPL